MHSDVNSCRDIIRLDRRAADLDGAPYQVGNAAHYHLLVVLGQRVALHFLYQPKCGSGSLGRCRILEA